MSQDDRTPQQSNPLGEYFQALFGGQPSAQAMGGSVQPLQSLMKGVALYNLEAMALASRRAHAWSEMPGRIAQCQEPKDLFELQTQFWQKFTRDYSEAAQRVTSALAKATPADRAIDVEAPAEPPQRDYITFTEPTAVESADSERKAA